MRTSKTPRNFQEGFSKKKHKLSNYVEDGLKKIILNQTNLFLKETHTFYEHMVFMGWMGEFKTSFEDLKDYDWFKSCENRIMKEVKFKN